MQATKQATKHDLIITNTDLQKLLPVLDQHDSPAAESLDAELHRATIVEQRQVPPDVVTMNSEVVYEDLTTHQQRTVRVVFPKDADANTGRVSADGILRRPPTTYRVDVPARRSTVRL